MSRSLPDRSAAALDPDWKLAESHSLLINARQRQPYPERRALAGPRLQLDGAVVGRDQRRDDGQPQARAAVGGALRPGARAGRLPGTRLVHPVEPLEDPFGLLRR